MNEIRLDKEQQYIVIAQAVRIMRQRTLGSIQSLHIDHVDQEFLALSKENVGKKFPKIRENDDQGERQRKAELWPEELDVISVSRAIEEAVRELMASERPDILKPYIARSSLDLLGNKVIEFLWGKNVEKIKLPSRIASSIQTNMIRMEEEVSHLEALVREKIITHKWTEAWSTKGTLAGEINQLLMQIEELNKELLALSEKYDFSSLLETEPDSHDEEEPEESNLFDEWWGLMERDEMPGDNLMYEENIGLSSNEKHLLGYLPETLKKSETLLDDSFSWFTEWEEWQRTTFHIRNFPDKYREMLEKMLHRKQIIAFYAKHTLEKEEARRSAGKQKFSWPWLGKIRKYLPQLEEEIEDILGKIQSIWTTWEDEWDIEETSEAEKIQDSLEESLDYLYGRYETTLYTYVQLWSVEQVKLTADIREISGNIIKTYRDLSHHCQKHNLTSQHIITVSEWEEELDSSHEGALSINEYLDNPDYFEIFPDTLITQKSDSEKNLLVLCDVSIEKEFLPTVLEWNKVHMFYQEDDGSESSPIQKMKILEEVLQIVLRRKMIIYFECSEKIRACPHEEAQHHLSTLKQEIESMHRSVLMLSNRIQWIEEPDNMSSNIESEIRHLSQDRFHFLYGFLDVSNPMSRQVIGQKILQLCLALEKRRNILFDADKQKEIPEGHIPVEWLSYSESRLLRYVFPDIREWESEIFAKNTPFVAHPWKSGRENKLDMQKARLSQLSERKMMIYFFAKKRIDEIDIEIYSSRNDTPESLMSEREEIEQYLGQLSQETYPLLQELQSINESPVPRQEAQQKLFYQDLYNEAMKVLWSLDGMIAHVEWNHQKMVRDYWEKIQRQVLRFSDRIKIEESKWNFHMIPALQDEFDTEMVQIINDIKQYLTKILERQWHKGNEPEVLSRVIDQIRERLFGKPQTH
jgi:hypothetical protein